jgi:hypothetical protein
VRATEGALFCTRSTQHQSSIKVLFILNFSSGFYAFDNELSVIVVLTLVDTREHEIRGQSHDTIRSNLLNLPLWFSETSCLDDP